jgi:hypothetical protein
MSDTATRHPALDNPIVKDWLKALRSGEFKQGAGNLQTGDAYCCLGVACVVAERHGLKVLRDDNGISGQYLGSQAEVMRAIGLRLGNGGFRDGEVNKYLAAINDDAEATFPEIADIIEANADTLFRPLPEGGAA